ncbi:MAG: hypothetical protein ACR2NZ_00555 [Rubripirellula sp.]
MTLTRSLGRCCLPVNASLALALLLGGSLTALGQDSTSAGKAMKAILAVGKEGAGFDQAIPAAEELRQLPTTQIPTLLNALVDSNPLAENWLRGVIFDVVRKSGQPSLEMLEGYVLDTSNNPKGRGLAMELLKRQSPEQAEKLIDQCLDDASLPLREMAVEQAIERTSEKAKDDPEAAKQEYRTTLAAARHPRQLTRIISALDELGDPVKPAEAFSMITSWQSLAPLDNVDGVGFAAEYGPEKEFVGSGKLDLKLEHPGKQATVQWKPLTGSPEEGDVDLAAAYDKEKGAVGYLYTEFESAKDQAAQVRLGCINANKVWINGELVMQNEVYHSGSMIDQYIAEFPLQKGTNRILLKICQNEQEEPWAQDWKFQFRITDPSGKGLISQR